MKTPLHKHQSGAVLIIVMWVAFGLVSLALYFGYTMSFELRAADNRVAASEAEQAIEGAARYISVVLSNYPGVMPELQTYHSEAVPVGKATFWIIGRSDENSTVNEVSPAFGLIDEGSKMNLNTAAQTNLECLPRMTANLAASIMIWKGKTNDVSGGASDLSYANLKPPYTCKGSNFESVAELRLVYGTDMQTLYGEDANLNGILDPNETDGDELPPADNSDGRLDPGILEYLTVYTSDPNLRTNGALRVNINSPDRRPLEAALKEAGLDAKKIAELIRIPPPFSSTLDFYVKASKTISEADFELFADSIATDTNSPLVGLINPNSASAEVLASLDGFTTDMAAQVVSYRKSNINNLRSIAWVATALGLNATAEVPRGANRLTTRSYQFTADIAAVGHHDRGYRRVRFVFDTSSGSPAIIFRQDLSHLGWALGKDIRAQMLIDQDLQ